MSGIMMSTIAAYTSGSYYTIALGTKAPVLGSGGQSPFPAAGWSSRVSASQDDAFIQTVLPFSINFNNTSYQTTVFPSSNFFITFGTGSSSLFVNASNPAFNKICIAGADNSWQRVSTKASGTDYFRIRCEGTNSVSGTPGSPNMVYEATFFNPTLCGGVPFIELLVGQQARGTSGAFSAICSASAVLPGGDLGPTNQGVSPNQSYVLVGNARGTSWTVNTGYYISNSGY